MKFDNSRKSVIVLVVNVNDLVVTVQNNAKCFFSPLVLLILKINLMQNV